MLALIHVRMYCFPPRNSGKWLAYGRSMARSPNTVKALSDDWSGVYTL
jgi:hypothetical protein